MRSELKNYLKKYKSICWYPSAGNDFRGMMYLSRPYAKMRGWEEEQFPDCFLMTDVCGFEYVYGNLLNTILNGGIIFDDQKDTRIEAYNGAELERIDIPFKRNIVGHCDENYGRVITANIKINSSVLGELNTTLIYVIMENTSFAIDYLLKNGIRIDYYQQVRYGMGISSGMYVKYLLKDFNTRYFISDWDFPGNEDYAYEQYESILKNKEEAKLKQLDMSVLSYQWSRSGDVHWYKVIYDEINNM